MPAPSLRSTCNWIWVILGCCQGWVLSTSHTHTSCCYFGAAGPPPLLSPPLLLLKPQVGSWGVCLRILKSWASGEHHQQSAPAGPVRPPPCSGDAHPAAPLGRAGRRTPVSPNSILSCMLVPLNPSVLLVSPAKSNDGSQPQYPAVHAHLCFSQLREHLEHLELSPHGTGAAQPGLGRHHWAHSPVPRAGCHRAGLALSQVDFILQDSCAKVWAALVQGVLEGMDTWHEAGTQ